MKKSSASVWKSWPVFAIVLTLWSMSSSDVIIAACWSCSFLGSCTLVRRPTTSTCFFSFPLLTASMTTCSVSTSSEQNKMSAFMYLPERTAHTTGEHTAGSTHHGTRCTQPCVPEHVGARVVFHVLEHAVQERRAELVGFVLVHDLHTRQGRHHVSHRLLVGEHHDVHLW